MILEIMTKFSEHKVYNVVCAFCGNTFRSKHQNKKICSPECEEAQRKKYVVERIASRGTFTSLCVICGKKFSNREPEPNHPRRRTCSARCRHTLSNTPSKNIKD